MTGMGHGVVAPAGAGATGSPLALDRGPDGAAATTAFLVMDPEAVVVEEGVEVEDGVDTCDERCSGGSDVAKEDPDAFGCAFSGVFGEGPDECCKNSLSRVSFFYIILVT